MRKQMAIPRVLTALMLGFVVALPGSATPRQKGPQVPVVTVGTAAPDFTLPDAYTGKSRNLREFSKGKRPIALFFFCGCPACHAVATEWAKYQRAGVLPSNAATLIVYSTSDRSEARHRIVTAGLDVKRTAVLCDTDALTVTESLYHAEPCPRLVVVDPTGKIVYRNLLDDEKPQEAPAGRLVARALAALEVASQPQKQTKP